MTEVMAFDPARRTSAQAILDLVTLGYLNEEQLTLDTTYRNGRFWTKWKPRVLVANDLDPRFGDTHQDYRQMREHWTDNFDVTVFDPPFKLNGTSQGRGAATCDDDYGVASGYRSLDAITNDIYAGLNECARVTKVGGLLLYKCQDQVAGGKRRWFSKDDYLEFVLPGMANGARIIRLIDELYICGYRKQPKDRECPRCGGTGNELLAMYRRCEGCGGSGRTPIKQKHSRSNVSVLQVYRKSA